jgi:hypothetical protein
MAATVTFDHLGETAEVQVGEWPEEQLLGRHPSVTESLPRQHSIQPFLNARFDYRSLAGAAYGLMERTPLLPYAWRNIDGDYYFERFWRLGYPSSDHPLGADGLLAAHTVYVDLTSERGGFTSFVFHVPWVDRPERFEAVRALLQRVRHDPRVWLASSDEIAAWMRGAEAMPSLTTHFDAEPAW